MSSNTIYGACPNITIGPFHYLYRITNLVEQKHYYGIRTSKTSLPQYDLGTKYFSSSQDKNFILDQKEYSENYRYKIIIVSDSRKKVADLEIKIHQKFNVGINPKFYNRTIQTSSCFDATGMTSVMDEKGKCIVVPLDDLRIASGELVGVVKGTGTFKNNKGKLFHTSIGDPRIKSGELVGIFKGMTPVKDENGKRFSVPIDDHRIASGEFQHINKGSKWIYNLELKQNKRIKSGEDLPEGWEFGRKNFNEMPSPTKDCRWIYNPELKQNKALKPDEELPIGWEFGVKSFNGKVLGGTKGYRWIHNTELKKDKALKPDEEIQEGWEFGRLTTTSQKNRRYIFNYELKQNRRIKPEEELPEGWQYGRKKFLD